MSLLAWIVLGAIAGWLASIVMKSRQGLIGNIIVGIIGAFVGGFVLDQLDVGGGEVSGLNLPSIGTAFIGAVIFLWLLRVIRK